MTKIELKHVSKMIHKKEVLHDISYTMESGKVYGFQGINGSGKTMLMRTIIGLIHPTEGIVEINGKALGQKLEFPESIGFLLENPAFLDRYSGYANLKLLAGIQSRISDTDIWGALHLVGLDEEAGKKKYRKYSLGMKQRLGIAAAVMEAPEIVILDEPTNSLDAAGVELVKGILKKQKERGALCILSCHDLPILESLSDEIIKLEEGKITEYINSQKGEGGSV